MALTKYRHPSWYWGRFIVKNSRTKWVDENGEIYPTKYVNLAEMEIYDEEKHGWHLSPEFAKERAAILRKSHPSLSAPYSIGYEVKPKPMDPYKAIFAPSKNTGEEN